MALVFADRVKVRAHTTGLGSFTLDSTVPGFQSFAAGVGNGNETYYGIVDQVGNWEIGRGTFVAPSTLTRDTVISSSNSGAKVNFPEGGKNVYSTFPASIAQTIVTESVGSFSFVGSTISTTDSTSISVAQPTRFFGNVQIDGDLTLAGDELVFANNVIFQSRIEADMQGSVFADDSSKIVDGTTSEIAGTGITATKFIKFPIYANATARNSALPAGTVEEGMVVYVSDINKLQINTDSTITGWADLN